ncbi:hypothetical protein C8R45DRAFT_931749 [Mycena sanguinolenta]|nr:hypothetical protein C8R45DRAFT_931749 [Mycena sanguinolenta]
MSAALNTRPASLSAALRTGTKRNPHNTHAGQILGSWKYIYAKAVASAKYATDQGCRPYIVSLLNVREGQRKGKGKGKGGFAVDAQRPSVGVVATDIIIPAGEAKTKDLGFGSRIPTCVASRIMGVGVGVGVVGVVCAEQGFRFLNSRSRVKWESPQHAHRADFRLGSWEVAKKRPSERDKGNGSRMCWSSRIVKGGILIVIGVGSAGANLDVGATNYSSTPSDDVDELRGDVFTSGAYENQARRGWSAPAVCGMRGIEICTRRNPVRFGIGSCHMLTLVFLGVER